MPDLEKMIQSVKDSSDYDDKTKLFSFFINFIKQMGNKLPAKDAEQLRNLAVYELKNLKPAIQTSIDNDAPYKQKNELFCYKDILLHLYMLATGNPKNASSEETGLIDSIIELTEKETVVENAVEKLFDHDVIVKSDVEALIDVMEKVEDTYRIGIMYCGLFHYREKISKFEPDANALLAEFIANQVNTILDKQTDEDTALALEYIADVCAYFPSDGIITQLQRILKTQLNRPRFYAVDSLLALKADVDRSVIRELAQDISIASLIHSRLKKHGRLDLYPNEYADEIYLAKSDITQWLLYPTELGKLPDKTEYLGKSKVKKEVYHIFKYMSDSDNLTDDLKNVWLIGWSCSEGGTFSNFDKLCDYEKKTPEKTVKNIVKKLIK